MRRTALLALSALSALFAFVVTLTTATAAHAQKVAPGLWENTVSMKSGSGQLEAAMAQMREQMARMTPEQRQQIEAMLASRGAGVGMAAGQPTTLKVCVTPEQAANDDFARHDGHCKTTSTERSGKTVRIRFVCEGERKTSGEGEFTIDSDKSHRGHMVVDTTVKGRPERIEMDSTGRWLSADCGAVKPRPDK